MQKLPKDIVIYISEFLRIDHTQNNYGYIGFSHITKPQLLAYKSIIPFKNNCAKLDYNISQQTYYLLTIDGNIYYKPFDSSWNKLHITQDIHDIWVIQNPFERVILVLTKTKQLQYISYNFNSNQWTIEYTRHCQPNAIVSNVIYNYNYIAWLENSDAYVYIRTIFLGSISILKQFSNVRKLEPNVDFSYTFLNNTKIYSNNLSNTEIKIYYLNNIIPKIYSVCFL